MSEFYPAYQNTEQAEGGYANHLLDRGGETYKGIARRFHPKWEGWAIIDKLKKKPGFPGSLDRHTSLQQLVKKFYRAEFWIKYNISLIDAQPIASEVYDTAVNCGPRRAIRFLQEAMNLCDQNKPPDRELTVDGKLGIHTAAAVNGFPNERMDILLSVLNLLQGEHYLNLCRKDSSQERFLHGWVRNRITLKPHDSSRGQN